MLIEISSPQQLGLLVRAARNTHKIRMDDVAGVGHVFVREVERGKETVQLGRVMRLLAELGIALKADVPEEVMPTFNQLKLTGVKPLKPRRSRVTGPAGLAGNNNRLGPDALPTANSAKK